jgi:SAM-dependent methyltransferase
MNSEANYWNSRGSNFFKYKGEFFYTITPIPHYYKRRKLLLNLIGERLRGKNAVLDYGCGDGYYLNHFQEIYSEKSFYGADISQEMLAAAKTRYPKVNVSLCHDVIQSSRRFDLVYTLMVLAHIKNDNEVINIFSNIHNKLNEHGQFIIFEQTAPAECQGEHWIRRHCRKYIEFGARSGFKLKENLLMTFPIEQWFERRIAPFYRKYFVKGSDDTERRFNANKSQVFKLLSSFFVSLTLAPIKKIDSRRRVRGGGGGGMDTHFLFLKNKPTYWNGGVT